MAFFSFLSWFRPWWKSTETDFETVLARLSTDIAAVQTRLTRVHTRQRRATVTLTIYAFVVWALYAAAMWFLDPWGPRNGAGDTSGYGDEEKTALQARWLFGWGPVLAGPVVILSTRRLVSWWYRRIADGEEKHLRSLQRTRRKKIDEIKLATRYDHLKMLLEKYDDTNPKNAAAAAATSMGAGQANAAARAAQMQRQKQQQQQQLPGGSVSGGGPGPGPGREPRQFQGKVDGRPLERGTPIGATSQQQPVQFPSQQQASGQNQRTGAPAAQQVSGTSPSGAPGPSMSALQQGPYQKTFLDRLADVMLGADPSTTGGAPNAAEQRYALICHICFNHNGLCHRDQWDEVQYICPRCGTFNTNRPSTVPVSSPWGNSPPASRIRTQSSMSGLGQTREKAQDGRHANRNSLGSLPSESPLLSAPNGSPLRQGFNREETGENEGERDETENAERDSIRLDNSSSSEAKERDSSTTALAGRRTTSGDDDDVSSKLRSRGTKTREGSSSPVMDVD